MTALRAWFDGRSLRERRLLLVMTALLVLVILWAGIIRPVGDGLSSARGRHADAVVRLGETEAAVEAIHAELGPIEILVTSAGISGFVPFEDLTVDQFTRTVAVNLTGTFHCAQAAIADMVAAGWGRIVTIS